MRVEIMVKCDNCQRHVPLYIKDNKIVCPECGEVIKSENISPEHDSISPEPMKTGTGNY